VGSNLTDYEKQNPFPYCIRGYPCLLRAAEHERSSKEIRFTISHPGRISDAEGKGFANTESFSNAQSDNVARSQDHR
jgi:hypothetical protein